MSSLYWDDFERRIDETVIAIQSGTTPPVRRVALFITDKCNFRCGYCNHSTSPKTLSQNKFIDVIEKYGDSAIIHITGGEPSTVKWLYPLIRENGHKYRFHLNTNAYITPPYEHVKRLKISMDDCNGLTWNKLVGVSDAFDTVIGNIRKSVRYTIVSLTYTLTRENYKKAPEFAKFINDTFGNDLYAVFFSVYKGTNSRFMITDDDSHYFFTHILPELQTILPKESLALLNETIDEKIRLINGVRFPGNLDNRKCYLSMSERVIAPNGEEYTCSHLYRDNVYLGGPTKDEKCLYGCNRRLVKFNEEVEKRLCIM
jgi:MoaA/NifB/PqqE/SkfB family radical SAM enzyme